MKGRVAPLGRAKSLVLGGQFLDRLDFLGQPLQIVPSEREFDARVFWNSFDFFSREIVLESSVYCVTPRPES